MGLISRVSSRTYRRCVMGSSQSKKPAAAAEPAKAPTNFAAENMQEVAPKINVGTFLLERSVLREQQRDLVNQNQKVAAFVQAKTDEVQKAAISSLEEYRQSASAHMKTKDQQIEELHASIQQLHQEKQESIDHAAAEKGTMQEYYDTTVAHLTSIIDDRGRRTSEVYDEKFAAGASTYPVRSHTAICADRIAAVGQCYKDSKGQTLNCSQMVKELQQCVDEAKKERL